jgi:hypothetical protein
MKRSKPKEYSINTYLERVPEVIKNSWSVEYRKEVEDIIKFVIPKPSPKIIDIRISINLFFSKFYIVLLLGPDQRAQARKHNPKGFSRIGNWIAGILILIVLNLAISLIIFMIAYYIKCSLGINLFKDEHLIDKINQIFYLTSF